MLSLATSSAHESGGMDEWRGPRGSAGVQMMMRSGWRPPIGVDRHRSCRYPPYWE